MLGGMIIGHAHGCNQWFTSSKTKIHLYHRWNGCMFGGWWLKIDWIECEWIDQWWGGKIRKNLEAKGYKLGFLGSQGFSKTKN